MGIATHRPQWCRYVCQLAMGRHSPLEPHGIALRLCGCLVWTEKSLHTYWPDEDWNYNRPSLRLRLHTFITTTFAGHIYEPSSHNRVTNLSCRKLLPSRPDSGEVCMSSVLQALVPQQLVRNREIFRSAAFGAIKTCITRGIILVCNNTGRSSWTL